MNRINKFLVYFFPNFLLSLASEIVLLSTDKSSFPEFLIKNNKLSFIRIYYTTRFLPNARTQRKMSFSIESIVTLLFQGLDIVFTAIDRSSWALEFSSANLAYFMLVYAFWINKMKSHSSLFYSILIYWIVCSTNLIIAILVLVNYKHL